MESLALLRPEGAYIEMPKKPVRVLGIDLGKTNSTVAELIWNSQETGSSKVRCMEIDQPTSEEMFTHSLIPSAVAIHECKVIVGEGAKRLRAQAVKFKLEQNQNLFYECKSDIGTRRTYHRRRKGSARWQRSAAKFTASCMAKL